MVNTATLKTRLGTRVQAIAKPVVNIESVADNSLATVNSSYLALNNNALEIIQENLKKQPLSFQIFDIVKSPSVSHMDARKRDVKMNCYYYTFGSSLQFPY